MLHEDQRVNEREGEGRRGEVGPSAVPYGTRAPGPLAVQPCFAIVSVSSKRLVVRRLADATALSYDVWLMLPPYYIDLVICLEAFIFEKSKKKNIKFFVVVKVESFNID